MNYRWLVLVLVVAVIGLWGCSKKEEAPSATVSVALQDTTKELPRLEQNYIYEKNAPEVDNSPFYYHETENSLKPMSEEEKKKAPPASV